MNGAATIVSKVLATHRRVLLKRIHIPSREAGGDAANAQAVFTIGIEGTVVHIFIMEEMTFRLKFRSGANYFVWNLVKNKLNGSNLAAKTPPGGDGSSFDTSQRS